MPEDDAARVYSRARAIGKQQSGPTSYEPEAVLATPTGNNPGTCLTGVDGVPAAAAPESRGGGFRFIFDMSSFVLFATGAKFLLTMESRSLM